MRRFASSMAAVLAFSSAQLFAGSFDSPSVPSDSTDLKAWASGIVSFQPTSSGSLIADGNNALGPPDGRFSSLGDLSAEEISNGEASGSVTLSFEPAITNGPTWDFAVFENAGEFFNWPFIFAELAYVEVSSNGRDFSRFPNASLNLDAGLGDDNTELITSFGRDFAGLNTTNVHNLAGVHSQGLGTAFDLTSVLDTDEVSSGLVDVNSIAFIRLVDIPGDGSWLDSESRPIFDAWPTGGTVGGFDLDAVGARHLVPEPNTFMLVLGLLLLAIRRQSREWTQMSNLGAALLLLSSSQNLSGGVINFEELPLPDSNTALAEAFTSAGADFPGETLFNCCWSGWVLSNSTLNQDLSISPGTLDSSDPFQRAHWSTVYVPPHGTASNYAVSSFVDSQVESDTVRTRNNTPLDLPAGETIVSIDVANTTWTAHSMLFGDSFSRPFANEDFFRLTIVGVAEGQSVGSVEVSLAKGRDVLSEWLTVPLTELHGADRLEFALASSDTTSFGATSFLNTPAFFAIDNIVTASIPEPRGMTLVGLGLASLMLQHSAKSNARKKRR